MRPIGFSTGALAYADFRHGLEMMRGKLIAAVELSALRQNELLPLLDALDGLNLSQFSYVAIHAPSQFDLASEPVLWARLEAEKWREWPVVIHPDGIHRYELWRELGPRACVENMDKRKPAGRTMKELAGVFEQLPEASFCFDIGHARQVDPTMTEARLILREFGSRLRQVHVSEVNTRSKHDRLSYVSMLGFQDVAHLIPHHVPLILETPVLETEMEVEIARVREALPLIRIAA